MFEKYNVQDIPVSKHNGNFVDEMVRESFDRETLLRELNVERIELYRRDMWMQVYENYRRDVRIMRGERYDE